MGKVTDAQAKRIVEVIERDLCDRQALGDVWDSIEPAIRAEIRRTWKRLVASAIRQGGGEKDGAKG